MVMMLAKEYGCLPQQIEQMDYYWLERMITLMRAENSYQRRQMKDAKKKR